MSKREGNRQTNVDVDLDEEIVEIEVVETTRRRITDLFHNGELRLWEDEVGWSGYLLDDGQFYEVNSRFDVDGYLRQEPVDRQEVIESIVEHVKDPVAGDAGRFKPRCSPP
jgi:hypothetical protein